MGPLGLAPAGGACRRRIALPAAKLKLKLVLPPKHHTMPQSAPHPNCCVRSEGSSSEVAPGLNVAQPTRMSVVTGVPSARHAHRTPSAVPITIQIRLPSPDLSTRANLLQHNTPSLSDTIASENCSNAPTGTDSTHKERETSPRPPSQTLGAAVLISYTHFRLRSFLPALPTWKPASERVAPRCCFLAVG